MTPDELVTFKITLKVFCKPQEISGSFKKYCTPNDQNNAQKNARLQGQYHPVTNTIDIQSDAYQGSLIHEYIHYLQYKNENLIDEKRYKFERANLQQSLVKLMDEKTLEVKESAKEKNQKKVKELVAIVVQASGQLMNYSPWQDLIDEKNIFLLYKKFGHEFGVKDEDLALASLNMGFICKRFKLPEAQCL